MTARSRKRQTNNPSPSFGGARNQVLSPEGSKNPSNTTDRRMLSELKLNVNERMNIVEEELKPEKEEPVRMAPTSNANIQNKTVGFAPVKTGSKTSITRQEPIRSTAALKHDDPNVGKNQPIKVALRSKPDIRNDKTPVAGADPKRVGWKTPDKGPIRSDVTSGPRDGQPIREGGSNNEFKPIESTRLNVSPGSSGGQYSVNVVYDSRLPGTGPSHRQSTMLVTKQPDGVAKQPTTVAKQPTTVAKQPGTVAKPAGAVAKKPVVRGSGIKAAAAYWDKRIEQEISSDKAVGECDIFIDEDPHGKSSSHS